MAAKDFGALILAAGFSTRMGRLKMALAFDRERTFIGQCIHVYSQAGCGNIAVVVNHEGEGWLQAKDIILPEEVAVVVNNTPEKGRFCSAQMGLRALPGGFPVFIQNVDNPFVSGHTLQMLLSHAGKAACVRPVYGGQAGQPVLISSNTAKDIANAMNPPESVREFLQSYEHCYVETGSPDVLININTPADYRRYVG